MFKTKLVTIAILSKHCTKRSHILFNNNYYTSYYILPCTSDNNHYSVQIMLIIHIQLDSSR